MLESLTFFAAEIFRNCQFSWQFKDEIFTYSGLI